MTEEQAANWRDLCNAALTARDPEKLLQIIEKLNAVLEREEKQRHRRANWLQKFNSGTREFDS